MQRRSHVVLAGVALGLLASVFGAHGLNGSTPAAPSAAAAQARPQSSPTMPGVGRPGSPLAAGHSASGKTAASVATTSSATPTGAAPTVPASAPASAPTSVAAPTPDAPASSTPPPAPPSGPAAARFGWASQNYNLYKGANTSNRVMLTFDDCPNSLAAFKAVVLDAERRGIALALFPTGQCLRSGKFDPAFARAHGQYVFNHSVSHPEFWKLSPAQVDAQLKAPGVQTSWGRPPYGEVNAAIKASYARAGMRIWLWTVDTRDWAGHPAQAEVVRRAVTESKAGGTVLMHMQESAFTPDAVAAIQAGLAAKGLGVCRNSGPVAVAPQSITC